MKTLRDHYTLRPWASRFALIALSCLAMLAYWFGTGIGLSGGETHAQRVSEKGTAELHMMLNVAKLAALASERLTGFADQAAELYEMMDDSLVWIRAGTPTSQAREVLKRMQHAEEKGLDPNDYCDGRFGDFRFAPLELPAHPSESDLIRFDVSLTVAAMQYLSDLHMGRANPNSPLFVIEARGKTLNLPSFIKEELIDARDPASIIESVEPQFLAYRRTLAALSAYRGFQQHDDEAPLPNSSRPVEPGMSYSGGPRLRKLLRLVGDLPEARNFRSPTYDAELASAVERFQERHGLEPTGRLDPLTLRELNTPLQLRVLQLELALERWRWLPSSFTEPPIFVNIPEFRLHVVDEHHHIVTSMNVVVGAAYRHETPLFESEIRSVLFRPPWNVPLEIQRDELVPLLEKNPSYLAENSYDVVDARGKRIDEPSLSEETLDALRNGRLFLRQQPGEENSLGLIKFELPNPYDVYLHGTPAQELFSKSRRDFSHGCVRVEDPVALGAWVLRNNPGWNEERVRMSMHGSETQRVVLTRPVPIWIVYGTAVVLEDGRVRFFDDIYGQDASLEQELARTRAETSSGE